ncbi:hypothetical protein [Leptospira kirschneri]|nr:hypothetical protein [Leptospira kirschneri]EMN23924.1 hypothetical protein LEP1GSC065_0443 [Leptospira kirschneri serovar Sokoine str. RM1]EPG48831.1 hypothetical protein LEP1GSC049_1242 [Leptospira kirschneri serovar Cynopteri str. 3522 CT]
MGKNYCKSGVFHEKILKMWELIPDYDFTEKPEMMGTAAKHKIKKAKD